MVYCIFRLHLSCVYVDYYYCNSAVLWSVVSVTTMYTWTNGFTVT